MPKRVRTHVNPLSILKEHTFEGFSREAPLIVDVGACKGEFVEEMAQKFPEKNFIALEIRVPLARKLQEKFKDFPNVVVFDGDAGRNFKSLLGPSLAQGRDIETIYVNFPDPWFKEKHKKRRFINASFLEEMKDFLPATTSFVFQTDQKFLFEETLDVLKNSPYPDITFFENSPHGVMTDWEKAKVAQGAPIYRMRFKQKKSLR